MITRRRLITILAGASAVSTVLPKFSPVLAASQQWRGIALGAEAQIVLDHPEADKLLPMAIDEIHRLEAIFSLYQPNSQLARLNKTGHLNRPSFEMIELLSIAARVNAQTKGAFDPTVQPLWATYAEAFSATGKAPSSAQISSALDKTGWDNVHFDTIAVTFAKSEMALTLNGIAQGYIADKVTELFQREGVSEVLVNTGEISGLGHWPVTTPMTKITLRNQAIATSAIHGTGFDQAATVGHILDPRTGRTASENSGVSVVTTSAALADGLSTGFCILPRIDVEIAMRQMPQGSRVIFG